MKNKPLLLLAVMAIIGSASAANCGGTTACNCGDTLTSSQTMWYNLINCTHGGIRFYAAGLTLDCAGHTIDGDDSHSGHAGIDFLTDLIYFGYNADNGTLKNCIITDFQRGIHSDYATNESIINNIITSCDNGISLYGRTNTLTNNTANSNNENGIDLHDSTNNVLTNNTANNNTQYGIYLSNVDSNNLTSNTAQFNKLHGFFAQATSSGNILNLNTFCSNNQSGEAFYDIYNLNKTNTGDNNTCETPYNYDDTGTTGCTYSCIPKNNSGIPTIMNINIKGFQTGISIG